MQKTSEVLSTPRKPAAKIRAEHCYCSHPASDHNEQGCSQCDCQRHQARPCVCGHGAAQHHPTCEVEACDCKRFAEDRSPGFLLRRGVRAGEWQFITVDQLRFLMRPSNPDPTTRVWACGMLHSVGQRNRLAVKEAPAGKTPLSPADIVQELNALDPIGRMTKQTVRRELVELEQRGAVRRSGRHRNNVRLYFYLKPLTAKTVQPEPTVENLVVCTDYQISPSGSKDATYRSNQISHIQGTVVKSFLGALRKDLMALKPGLADLVVHPDYQNLVQQTAQEAALVVCSAYQRLLLVVCSDSPYKEDSISSSKGDPVPASSSNTPPIVENTPEPEPETTTTEKDPVLEALTAYGPAEQEAAETLTMKCREMVPNSTLEEIAMFVHMAGRQTARNPNVRNQIGVLIKKVPALLRTHLKDHRAAEQAKRRETAELRQKNRQEWERWLHDPEASEDDKAFARRMLAEDPERLQ
ncbi:MAG: hypothetical protein IT160_07020 [Bryobacterales bacterium]|nr:hypothetical protein [Bryobacterales bacterium]